MSGGQRTPAPSPEGEVLYERLHALVRLVPRGRVATYGQIAALAGLPGHARQVGYALHALPDGTDVPWHRVLNARGEVSRRARPGDERRQRRLLRGEGVRFDARGRVNLERFGWEPDLTLRLEQTDDERRGRKALRDHW